MRTASRIVGRDTSNSAMRCDSAGSVSPSTSSPRMMALRICRATSSAVLGTRTASALLRLPTGIATKALDKLHSFLDFLPFARSEEHTSELQSLMRISYTVFCLKKKPYYYNHTQH